MLIYTLTLPLIFSSGFLPDKGTTVSSEFDTHRTACGAFLSAVALASLAVGVTVASSHGI